jgi:hypothetical protein
VAGPYYVPQLPYSRALYLFSVLADFATVIGFVKLMGWW